MKQNLIYGLLGLLLLPAALAYYPGETVRIPALYTVNGVPTSSYANITIYNPNNITVVNNVRMIESQVGLFYHDYTFPNLLGAYTVLVKFYNSTWDMQGSASDDLWVEYNYMSDINESLSPNLPSNLTANDTTLDYHCPRFARINETFTIWADYQYAINLTDVLGANATIHNSTVSYPLTYNPVTGHYEENFSSATNMTWQTTLSVSKGSLVGYNRTCNIRIGSDFAFTVRLWEEVELKTEFQNKNYIITDENYNKQLTDPYINDFGYVIAKNNDHNATGQYTYCNIPVGSVQQITGAIAGIIGSNLTNLLTNDVGNVVGCDDYWFHAEYTNGSATLALPWAGNYSLYFLDGTVKWENDYAPPQLIKSGIFMPLGEINIPYRMDMTQNFWISHEEIDFWASFTDSAFIWLITLLPIILFIGLILIGCPMQIAGIVLISIESLWLFQNILHLF
jgi:hypothetical protein